MGRRCESDASGEASGTEDGVSGTWIQWDGPLTFGWVRVRRSLSAKVREVIVVGMVPRVMVVAFVRAGKGVGVTCGYAGIVRIWLLLFVGEFVSIEEGGRGMGRLRCVFDFENLGSVQHFAGLLPLRTWVGIFPRAPLHELF